MKTTTFLKAAKLNGWALCLLLGFAATQADAAIIAQNTSGSFVISGSNVALGQSVTIPTGNSWNNISFNLVDIDNNPYALGGLFLLTQSYTGLTASLSAATSGFLASTTTIAGGVWSFASDVTLAANTPYFLYMNTIFNENDMVRFSNDTYSGGTASQGGSSYGYHAVPSNDTLFTLSGTEIISSVPEAGALPLMGLALAGFVAMRTRARQTPSSAAV
jgi:hypothetical protein